MELRPAVLEVARGSLEQVEEDALAARSIVLARALQELEGETVFRRNKVNAMGAIFNELLSACGLVSPGFTKGGGESSQVGDAEKVSRAI